LSKKNGDVLNLLTYRAWEALKLKAESNMAGGFILEVRANAGILLFQTGNNQVNFQIN
jgi:hypothetical protein